MNGRALGVHRVLEPVGALPQAAWRVDNTPVCGEDEILIEVERLHVDAASFAQMRAEAGEDAAGVAEMVERIVRQRGKLHNPVTGSGGMLIGRVAAVGSALVAGARGPRVGERIATLVSLSLTPLWLERVERVHMTTGQVDVRGKAVLFASGLYAPMPPDLPDGVSLALFDVCGAPAQTARRVRPGDAVVVLGAGGKAGSLALRQARLSAGHGRIVAVEPDEAACHRLRAWGWADAVLRLDARDPLAVADAVATALQAGERSRIEPMCSPAEGGEPREGGEAPQGGGAPEGGEPREGPPAWGSPARGRGEGASDGADVVINCVSAPGTEMASILCARDGGTVLFFGMATSFTAAALGAEGVGKDVRLEIGNGYCRGHAELALHLVRDTPELLDWFRQRYGD
ncbi:L-erythro-3,5-diaminohexanoate dehydrogenase [Alicyclobacillus sp.]|uniref:L-erythro-3,5-diaminohexanoate dehydrogenase n=1 Tax=Alicyclobacillus sp. TaxID=61169 RepID=UPI0025C6DECD|nr:L-erythro-3,5-diaminohexanoate dehydrogenase [Alicyclobacillus sp.]MCL6518073.1 L-erythro-3,5-diaminohexanoate dehydrogenase [Alicyclobacillus sp.]